MKTDESSGEGEFVRFEDTVQRIGILRDIGRLVNWDQQVTMPDAGTTARSQQKSVLSAIQHGELLSNELERQLAQLENRSLSGESQAMVRETRSTVI